MRQEKEMEVLNLNTGHPIEGEENFRKDLVNLINENPTSEISEKYGVAPHEIYNTKQLTEHFNVKGFAAPFVIVERKCDGVSGTLMFQHSPRYYWGFRED